MEGRWKILPFQLLEDVLRIQFYLNSIPFWKEEHIGAQSPPPSIPNGNIHLSSGGDLYVPCGAGLQDIFNFRATSKKKKRVLLSEISYALILIFIRNIRNKSYSVRQFCGAVGWKWLPLLSSPRIFTTVFISVFGSNRN